ncbi:MAG TPA: hypothetical protein VN840_04945 [Streptosporangiaceae bacterium]|nr:hypothetical protein [Streptosporangiaceae bacterium]
MHNLQIRELGLASFTLMMAAGMTLTACSSGGSSSPTSSASSASSQPAASSAPASSAPPGSEPATGAGALAAIKTNWIAFFNAKTPTARRIALLQNGPVFAAVIRAQAGSPLAQLATATVSKVTLTGTDQAGVIYNILASGQVALSDQPGVAVYQNGTWKVGLASFCGLLKIENLGKSKGLPSGCKG